MKAVRDKFPKPACPTESSGATTERAATQSPSYRRRGFAALFDQHNETLVRFLHRKLGSEHEARDVAQEAYVRILGLEQTNLINHLRAYLFRTAANIAMDRLREKARRANDVPEHLATTLLESPHTQPDKRVLGQQQLERLQVAIARLPPKCRYAFLRFRIHEESYRDIAAEMGLSESMVRKYVLAALRYCKAYVEDTR